MIVISVVYVDVGIYVCIYGCVYLYAHKCDKGAAEDEMVGWHH